MVTRVYFKKLHQWHHSQTLGSFKPQQTNWFKKLLPFLHQSSTLLNAFSVQGSYYKQHILFLFHFSLIISPLTSSPFPIPSLRLFPLPPLIELHTTLVYSLQPSPIHQLRLAPPYLSLLYPPFPLYPLLSSLPTPPLPHSHTKETPRQHFRHARYSQTFFSFFSFLFYVPLLMRVVLLMIRNPA